MNTFIRERYEGGLTSLQSPHIAAAVWLAGHAEKEKESQFSTSANPTLVNFTSFIVFSYQTTLLLANVSKG